MTTKTCPSARSRAESLASPRLALLAATGAVALLLAACGGGGGGGDAMATTPPPATPSDVGPVPASAAATTASWEAFAIAQVPDDRIQPLRLDRIASVPTSETEAPIALQP